MSGNTLLRINAGQVTAKSVLAEDPNLLWRVYEDRRSNIWLCTQQNGLYLVSSSGALRHFSTTNGLTEQGIRSAFEDGEGNIWLGSSGGGLMRMKRRTFVQPDMSLFSPTMRMTALVEESPGRILIGSYGNGLGRRENGRLDRIEALQGGPIPSYIQSVLVDRGGNLWIATYRDGVCVLDKNQVLRRLATDDAGGVDSAALFEDTHSRIWIAGDKTVSLFADGQFHPFTNSAGLFLGGVKCFAEDSVSGAIWAASAEGLFRFEGGRWSEIKDGAGHSLDETICLRADSGGTLWIGGSTVPLRRLRAGLLTTIAEGQGLPARVITSILDDGLGYWWLASNLGVIRVARRDLEQAAGGGSVKLSCQLFNLSDGLPSVECVPGFQSTGLKDSEGRLWFATLKGVVTVDPKTLNLNTKPPPVFINEFRVEKMSGERTSRETSGLQPIVIAPGQREIMVGFSALSYTAPEKVRFAYKVEGFHNDWMDIGNRSDLYFYPPPPGKYRLQIKAANNDGVWNQTGASLDFTIEPFLWQTLWFRVLAMTGLASGCGLAAWRTTRSRYRRRIALLKKEQALEHEQARLATIMEATTDLVAFADCDGRLLHVNPAGRKLLGCTAGEDISSLNLTSMSPLWAADRLTNEAIPAARRAGTWEGESVLLARDGREIPVSQVIIAHKDASGKINFLSTIARDIIERKQAEKDRERLLEELLQSRKMESVGRLAGGIAHDFNNMMQVVLVNTSLAMEITPPRSELYDHLKEIEGSANRSADLTRRLLAFARKQEVQPQVLDLNETVSGMLNVLGRLIGENLVLSWVPGEDLWLVNIDPLQVDQILANLAVNARDAIAGQGTVVVRTANTVLDESSVRARADRVAGEFVVLSVSDTGKGMTPDMVQHIFEPFYTTKEVGKGTGLGLATVFGIVKQNGGWIEVETELDRGSTFKVFLPRSQSSRPSRTGVGSADAALPGGTETILVVEDEPMILKLSCDILKRCGYTILSADSPEKALALVAGETGEIHLLVTDVIMPGMSGKDLKDRLQAMRPGLKCLFMSGYDRDIFDADKVGVGQPPFLQKPFTQKVLASAVRQLLGWTE